MNEITTLKLDSITVDEDVQIRIGGLNEDKVREYAEVVDQLPLVDVFLENGTYWLSDGFHRYEAHRRAGCTEIQARVRRGGRKAAAEHSVLANARHGLPMNRAEKKRAVKRMLRFHPDWSNNRLARSIGVDDKTVARYRAELVSTSEIAKVTTREGADGKTRQVPMKGHVYEALISMELCPHGLKSEYCSICHSKTAALYLKEQLVSSLLSLNWTAVLSSTVKVCNKCSVRDLADCDQCPLVIFLKNLCNRTERSYCREK